MSLRRLEYRVAYRRAGHDKFKYRIFQTWRGARTFLRKLEGDDGRWGRLTDLQIDGRPVGGWEVIDRD